MNLQWVEEIQPVLEEQEFLSGLIEIAEQNGIRCWEWWLEEEQEQ